MITGEESWTTFLRAPNEVVSRLDQGDVILKRRDASALRLSLAARTSAESQGTELTARLLREALARAPSLGEVFLEAVERDHPWVRLLPPDARETFVREFLATLEACSSVASTAPLVEMLAAWKSTAEIYADPVLAAELMRPLPGTDIPVPRPRT